MYTIINNKKIEIKDANTFLKKFKGLMFKKNIDYCLRFKCNGIHTFFMKEEIDVILTDKDNNVLHSYICLKKNKILLPKKNVYYTYEFPKNTLKNKITKIKIEV